MRRRFNKHRTVKVERKKWQLDMFREAKTSCDHKAFRTMWPGSVAGSTCSSVLIGNRDRVKGASIGNRVPQFVLRKCKGW